MDERRKASWGFEEGDEIVDGRIALARLGGGKRFEVYSAVDDALATTVVVKILRPDKVEGTRSLAALRREASHLGTLAHPSIVRLFDAVLDGPRPHLVLEHVEGPTLRSVVRRYGPLEPEQVLPLTLGLGAALHYLHGCGVVHLDIKPSNVVMAARPMLIDLSAARTVEEAAALREPIGTEGWMPPEQRAPSEAAPVGPAADVWAAGATVRASTGWTVDGGYPRAVPPLLREALDACLAEDPSARPSPAGLMDSIEQLVAALPRRPVLRRARPRLA